MPAQNNTITTLNILMFNVYLIYLFMFLFFVFRKTNKNTIKVYSPIDINRLT